jgi:hypothetical protein
LEDQYYCDSAEDSQKAGLFKKNWLIDAYGEIVHKSQPKTYLLKLVEYNKIEINESGDQCFIQNTEIETVMCCLMK